MPRKGESMYKKGALLFVIAVLSGCTGMQTDSAISKYKALADKIDSAISKYEAVADKIDSAISKYEAVADKVDLGDSKEKVLSILQPTQASLPKSTRKSPEKYIKDGVKVEIYYMRSARQPDGLTTDDEFVPYLFNNGKLVGIGWRVLGGPKTRGRVFIFR